MVRLGLLDFAVDRVQLLRVEGGLVLLPVGLCLFLHRHLLLFRFPLCLSFCLLVRFVLSLLLFVRLFGRVTVVVFFILW